MTKNVGCLVYNVEYIVSWNTNKNARGPLLWATNTFFKWALNPLIH